MSEKLQLRTDHSRSLEDAEKYRALETLKEVGLLIPLVELDTFHGRVGTQGEIGEWAVDPAFSNGGNDSGNYNVNSRPTLYSSDEATAQAFADERAGFPQKYIASLAEKIRHYTSEENIGRLDRQNAYMREIWEEDVASGYLDPATSAPTVWDMEQLLTRSSMVEVQYLEELLGKEAYIDFKHQSSDRTRAEVHEIVTPDTDATVLDFSFNDANLDDAAQYRYKQALKVLVIPLTEGSPVNFNDRDKVQPFMETIQKARKHVVLKSEVRDIAGEAGIGDNVALQLASAYNAQRIGLMRPSYLVSQLLKNSSDIVFDTMEVDGARQEIPINLEYVQRFLRNNHIVGVKQSISSATLGKVIASVSFFDLEKTIAAKGWEAQKQATLKRLGNMATSLGQLTNTEVLQSQSILRLLEDAHAKPDKLVAAARLIDGYAEIFDGDTGNWEGFTLAEHTETVLRNFDESFADTLPVELLAPMRLAILAHDVGKPKAAAAGQKHRQKEYNVIQADDFLNKLGVDERLKNLLLAIIGDGEELAFQIYVRGDGKDARGVMKDLATETLRRFHGSDNITDEQVSGFTEMCKVLQACDGGAYTSVAITRRGGGKGRYRNAPSFNTSFAQPVGFGKRTIRLREAGDEPAISDQTPKIQESPSRLKISHSGIGRRPPTLTT